MLAPAWTTDWMTADIARDKLRAIRHRATYGQLAARTSTRRRRKQPIRFVAPYASAVDKPVVPALRFGAHRTSGAVRLDRVQGLVSLH